MQTTSKLNIFQRGILQAVLSVAIASAFLFVGQITFIRLYTSGFFDQGVVTIFFVLASSLVMVAITFVVMKLTMKMNIATKITLPKVVEFSYAMQSLGVHRFDEQIDFIARARIFIFLADVAMPSPYKEGMSVKRYIFLKDKEKLKYYNGDKRLCLDAEDYERLLQKRGEYTKSAFFARITALEQNVTDLKAVNSLQSADIAKITEENEKLLAENAEYRNKLKTAPGREVKAEKRELDKIPFWRVAVPVVNRLISEAESETQYTRPQIQDAFLLELENFPELKAAIQVLLHTSKKERENTPFSLEGWGMEAIRSALGEFVQTEGSAPKKTKKH